ncbi:MAG: tyrosine-type recombinase/integrase [Chloroflexi bacterium]|nr:tyrosine-type recombinase/integrase [Chloroflexota bacterium]
MARPRPRPGPDGRPQYRQAFLRGFRRLLASASAEHDGLEPLADHGSINWHTLRHSAGSLWIRAGADVFTVSRRLGHASASFTMDTYAHLLSGQQQHAATALDHLIGAN